MPSDFDEFYVALGERFRGEYADIKERLRFYARYLQRAGGPPGPLVDLGVGRGELLELAKDAGWEASGVDFNPRLVESVRARGFDVSLGDAVNFLAAAPADSLGAITAIHIVEHLSAQERLRLFREAHRTLKAGGFLFAEWPNPGNPRVAHYTFWFDPTHVALLPHELVSFTAEYVGFRTIEIVRLENGKAVKHEAMDIALIARKSEAVA